MRLGDDRLVDAHAAFADQLRRERAGLEEAGLPQPFVEPQPLGRRLRRTHRLPRILPSAANGVASVARWGPAAGGHGDAAASAKPTVGISA